MKYTVSAVAATPETVQVVLTAPHVPSVLPAVGAVVVVLEDPAGGAEAVALALEAIGEISDEEGLAEASRALERRAAQVRARGGSVGEADVPGGFGSSFGTDGL
jgi:hypothetical protein